MEPYRPSNGTEGEFFMAEFCDRCAKLGDEKRGWCKIQGATFMFDVNEPGYPAEWVRDADGTWPGNPRCTAFERIVPEGQAQIDDSRQLGLFA